MWSIDICAILVTHDIYRSSVSVSEVKQSPHVSVQYWSHWLTSEHGPSLP